jgi:hypothetical protein
MEIGAPHVRMTRLGRGRLGRRLLYIHFDELREGMLRPDVVIQGSSLGLGFDPVYRATRSSRGYVALISGAGAESTFRTVTRAPSRSSCAPKQCVKSGVAAKSTMMGGYE